MQSIFRIFQINSNENIIRFFNKEDFEVKYVGNGFFVTKDGYLASVAHVFNYEANEENKELCYYALISNSFHKIENIKQEFTERNENHRDIAIGKINFEHNIDFIDLSNSDEVSHDSITIKGYFRSSKNNELIQKFIKFPTICIDTTHNSLHNCFSFVINGESLYGMSGSPIFNEQDKIVGIVKGGDVKIKGHSIMGHAIHIRLIIELLHSLNI